MVEELKRLTLENARLASALVMMDRERELHPITGVMQSAGLARFVPWVKTYDMDPGLLYDRNTGEAFDRVRRAAVSDFAAELLESGRTFISIAPDKFGSLGTPRVRVGAWLSALGGTF